MRYPIRFCLRTELDSIVHQVLKNSAPLPAPTGPALQKLSAAVSQLHPQRDDHLGFLTHLDAITEFRGLVQEVARKHAWSLRNTLVEMYGSESGIPVRWKPVVELAKTDASLIEDGPAEKSRGVQKQPLEMSQLTELVSFLEHHQWK